MKSILVITQQIVAIEGFNNLLVDYKLEELTEDTKENIATGMNAHQHS